MDLSDIADEVLKSLLVAAALGIFYWLGDLLSSRKRRREQLKESLELLTLLKKLEEDFGYDQRALSILRQYPDVFSDKRIQRELDYGKFIIALLPCIASIFIMIQKAYKEGFVSPVGTPVSLFIFGLFCWALAGIIVAWSGQKVVNKVTRQRLLGYIMSFMWGVVFYYISIVAMTFLFQRFY